MRTLSFVVWLAAALPLRGAERVFDFQGLPPDKTPPEFRSVVAGEGPPGDWRILMDEVPPLLAPLTDKAPVVTRRAVLAQLSRDPTDERFPMLIFDGDTFTDFTLTTRFKLVGGEKEQMAGIAFRVQDERNFYVIRASGLGRNIRFYKMIGGERSVPIGPQVEIARGVWHELKIECKGNQIRCWLNGQDAIPTLTDNSLSSGRFAFWTKSDSVSYFADTRITYKPREPLAAVIVRDLVAKYPRMRGLKIYTLDEQGEPKMVASKDPGEVGGAGGKSEREAIAHGHIFYGKAKKTVSIVWPLRDRNGEPIAAIRFILESFAGQTEQNALSRARPLVQEIQARVQTLAELTQ